MREALGLGLLALVLLAAAIALAVRLRRARIEREFRRGHGDYRNVKRPGGGWFG
ncbi:MAG: hypothetical protein KF780_05090 [Sphingomonas sp.]|nr:hypothetical protein [Sphingomonas sp.]